MLVELEKRLRIAQDAYQHTVTSLDKALKAHVAADPAHVEGALALQAQYPFAPTALVLTEAVQPEAPAETDIPTTPARRTRGPKKAKK